MEFEPLDTTGLQEKFDTWVAWLVDAHHGKDPRINSGDEFTPLAKPLADSRVALLSTAGVHLDDQEPFHVETVAGDATHRLIPDDVDLSRLRFTHTHYDTSSAEKDPNVVIPIDRLHELVADGRVGSAAPFHVGMMGFNPNAGPVADELAPAVVDLLHESEVDVAVFAPG